MRRRFRLFSGGLALAVFAMAMGQSRGAEIRIDHRTFTLPDGFVIEKIATPPLTDRPIVGSFDEQGRLYVADSSGSNEKVDIQLEKKPHRIVRLEDTDGDGKFDKSVVFADRLMFPEGTLWHRGSLYVSAPPSIWKLTDTDGDGTADQRVEWFQGKTLTGCANDLHGPYLGRDGRIYWAKGAFAEQTHQIHGKTWKTSAAHFFRSNEDGSELEPVMTGGMDNPVDMVFTPGGERIFTTTFLTQPSVGQRDGLIHAVYGGVYGKTNGKTQEPQHLWTGPDLMPVLSHMGPAAPCGLTDYESDSFGPGFRGNVFSSSFNLRKIVRHQLESTDKAGLTSKDSDFLICDDTDFHPTDVLTDADGSLIVIDTGGWYKLCCPTSHIAKADVLGTIYRVRRADAKPVEDPRGLKLLWENVAVAELAGRLGDARPAVRDRAIDALARLGEPAATELAKRIEDAATPAATRNAAIWAACRIGGKAGLAACRGGLGDAEAANRQAAVHGVGLHRDRESVSSLTKMLADPAEPESVRRAAAEALGRIGDPAAVPAILAAASSAFENRVLRHSLTYALLEIDSADAIFEALKSVRELGSRLAGLVALDQMGVPNLPVGELIAAMGSRNPASRSLASWIVSRHPEWADQLVADFRKSLSQPPDDAELQNALVDRLAKFAASSESIRELLAEAVQTGSSRSRSVALKAMAGSRSKTAPRSWESALQKTLVANELATLEDVLAALRALPPADGPAVDLRFRLLSKRAEEKDLSPEMRWNVLGSIPAGAGPVPQGLFEEILARALPANPAIARLAAADSLLKLKLEPGQKRRIAETLGGLGPMEAQKLIVLFENGADATIADALMQGLAKSANLASLREDSLRSIVSRLPDESKKAMDGIIQRRNQDLIQQRQKVDSLLASFPAGDIRRGQAVFNGAKAACRTCHSVGYVGGKVGPDLTKIGGIRTERDLLEAIVFPNLSFVRSYEPVTVAMKDGQVLSGIVQGEDTDTLTVVSNATQSTRIPKAEIDEIAPGTVSVMPAGLDRQLSDQELADLVTYLRSSK